MDHQVVQHGHQPVGHVQVLAQPGQRVQPDPGVHLQVDPGQLEAGEPPLAVEVAGARQQQQVARCVPRH